MLRGIGCSSYLIKFQSRCLNQRLFHSAPPAKRIQLFDESKKRQQDTHFCRGCGWEFQSEDPEALGYLPKNFTDERLDEFEDPYDLTVEQELAVENPICQRCWRMEHHNEITIEAPDQASKLKTLKDREGVILLLTDLCDLDIPEKFASKVAGTNPIILIGNKLDLVPKGYTDFRMRNWLIKEARRKDLPSCGVHIISSRTGLGVWDLIRDVKERSKNFKKDVFLCGKTNVGKSTLLNKLIKMYKGPQEYSVTVSPLHGTTIGLISVPLGHGGGRSIYDTPGMLDEAGKVLKKEDVAILLPQSKIVPKIWRLIPGKCLEFGDYGRLDYVEGSGHLLFTTFISKRLEAMTSPTAIEKADTRNEGKFQKVEFEFGPGEEQTWQKAWIEIQFGKIGAVSITGVAPSSTIKIVAHTRTSFPSPTIRESWMPFEAAAKEIKKTDRKVEKHGSIASFKRRTEMKD